MKSTREKIPVAFLLEKATTYVPIDNNGGMYYCFSTREQAEACLEVIRRFLLPYDNSIQDAVVSEYTLKETTTPFRFRLRDNQYKLLINPQSLRDVIRKNAPVLLPEDDYYIKHVRSDQKGFFYPFTHELIDTNYRLEKRKVIKENIRVTGNGISIQSDNIPTTKYPKRISKYTAEEKKDFTKQQSTSLSFDKQHSPVFGWKKRESLVIFIFGKNSVLLSDYLLIYDNGTVNRPYNFYTLEKAEACVREKVGRVIFSKANLPDFKKTLVEAGNKNKHNEVLARLQWQVDNNKLTSNKIGISKDNLETRLLAKQYAQSFELQLRKAGKCADDYRIPVVYYIPENEDLMHKEYTDEEYELDCLKALEIINDRAQHFEKFQNSRYEFLLGLSPDNISHLLLNSLIIDKNSNLPLPIHILHEGYVQIFQFLYEKSGVSLNKIMEEFLVESSGNQKLILSILYHALMGEALDFAEYLYQKIDFAKYKKMQEIDEFPPLMAAIEKNHVLWAKRILHWRWTNPDTLHTTLKVKPFFTAIYYNRVEIVKLFLDSGISLVNRCKGYTPLDLATLYSSVEIIKLLLAKGAIITSECHRTIMENQRFDVLAVLYDAHPSLPISEIAAYCDSKSRTECLAFITMNSLFIAIDESDEYSVKKYLRKNIDLNLKWVNTRNGKTVMEQACDKGNFSIVKLIADLIAPIHDDIYKCSYEYAFLAAHKNKKNKAAVSVLKALNLSHAQKNSSYLHECIKDYNWAVIKVLLNYNIDLSIKDENKETPIELACRLKQYHVVKRIANTVKVDRDKANLYNYGEAAVYVLNKEKFECFFALLDAGLSPNYIDEKSGRSLFHIAVTQGKLEVIERLLDYDPEFSEDKDKMIEIVVAAILGRFDIVECIATKKLANSKKDKDHYGIALFEAVLHKKHDCAYFLLKAGAGTNRSNDDVHNSIMHIAIQNDDQEMLLLLLKHDVDIPLTHKNKQNLTPIQLAAKLSYYHLVEIIAERKKTDENDLFGYNIALLRSVKDEKLKHVRLLLRAGASYNVTDPATKNSLLHIAILSGNIDIIKILLKHADLSLNNKENLTPIRVAVELGRYDIVQLISDARKTDVDDSFDYCNALVNAAHENKYDCVYSLLVAGASVNYYRNVNRYTALHESIQNDNKLMVKLLLKYDFDLAHKNINAQTAIQLAYHLKHYHLVKRIVTTKKTNEEDTFRYGDVLLNCIQDRIYNLAIYMIKSGIKTSNTWARDYGKLLAQLIADKQSEIASHLLGYNVDISDANKVPSTATGRDYYLRSRITDKYTIQKTGYLNSSFVIKRYNELIFNITIILVQAERQQNTCFYYIGHEILQRLINHIIQKCNLSDLININNSINNTNKLLVEKSVNCFAIGYDKFSFFTRSNHSKVLVDKLIECKYEPEKIYWHINHYLNQKFAEDAGKTYQTVELLRKYHLVDERNVKNMIEYHKSLKSGKKPSNPSVIDDESSDVDGFVLISPTKK